jgi:indolepyruvate ferredoxin oxidoreductase beta subunit
MMSPFERAALHGSREGSFIPENRSDSSAGVRGLLVSREDGLDLKIVICGVGGQGILFMAKVLYAVAELGGDKVLGSETHGMSQRGGSVTSHVKIGDYASPMVRSGTADILFALEAEESYKNLHFLRKSGSLLLNAPKCFHLDPEVTGAIEAKDIAVKRFDATEAAVRLGNPVAANLVLLSAGIDLGILPITRDRLVKAVEKITPTARIHGNREALRAGAQCIQKT